MAWWWQPTEAEISDSAAASPFVNNSTALDPKAAPFQPTLRTWLQSPFTANIPPAPPPQFRQSDWPLPKTAPRAINLGTWLQSPFTGNIPADQAPFAQLDWPLPKRVQQNIAALAPPNLNTTTLAVVDPFKPYAWNLPARAATPAQALQPQNLSLTLHVTPFRQNDWQLPRKAPQQPIAAQQVNLQYLFEAAIPLKPTNTAIRPITGTFRAAAIPPNILGLTSAPADKPFANFSFTLPRQKPPAVPFQYPPFNLVLNGITTPVEEPDCGHLYPSTSIAADLIPGASQAGALTQSTSTAGRTRSTASKAGSARSTASKSGALKSEITC